MIKLTDIPPDQQFYTGSIFRLYDVGRIGVSDRSEDYYDLMLVDISLVKENTFLFINATQDSNTRGKLVGELKDITSNYFVLGRDLHNYFSADSEIFFVED